MHDRRVPWQRTAGRIAAVGLLLAVASPAQADVAPPADREPYNVFTVGDSYAAGEGAPQRDGVYDADGDSPNPREDWDTQLSESTTAGVDTERCHRSPLSTSGVATGYLAADFPDIQTVFRSVACSGGAIVAGAALDRDDPVNGNANEKPFPGGVLRSYSGEDFLENFDPRPATPRFDPQLNQIDDILAAGAASFDRPRRLDRGDRWQRRRLCLLRLGLRRGARATSSASSTLSRPPPVIRTRT